MRKLILTICLILSLGLMTSQAQIDRPTRDISDDATLTLTEQQINDVLATVVDEIDQVQALAVDTYADGVVISVAVYDENGDLYNVSVTLLVGASENGAPQWTLASATVNGFNVPPSVVDDINEIVQSSDVAQARAQLTQGVVVEVAIDDDSITWDINDELVDEVVSSVGETLPEELTLPDNVGETLPDDFTPPDTVGETLPDDITPPERPPRDGNGRGGNGGESRPPRGR